MRVASACLGIAGAASVALAQANFSTGPQTFTSVHTFSFSKDAGGSAVDGFSIFVDYIGDGGGTWASDTNCMVTAPDGQIVSIGGFGTPADLDYDYQGSISGAPGFYTSGPHFGYIDGGPADGIYTVKLTQDFGVGFFADFQVNILRGPGGGDDCGIKKSPDQGAFWQPLGPTGSYVYANAFTPCNNMEVGSLGTWLLDQGGTGGPDVRFEVWGSIGGNAANGPDAGNVIASTGSLNLAGTPNLDFYSASASGSLSGGTTYWFVATCVGEGGAGTWQTGAHTQNSEGIVDNGTFWFSNDPAGINFDGQNFTPEFAFCVSPALGASVGYYTDANQAATDPEGGIIANGLNPVQITTLTGFNFNSISMLVINESANGPPSGDVLGALPAIQNWVNAGGKLIVHDRFVSNGGLENNPFFVGAPGMLAMRDFTNDANVDIQTTGTDVTEGSFGTLNDASLDGGTSSTHGWVDANTLPTNQSVAILELGGEPSKIAGLSYTLGGGAVYYSTIPLDYYLAGNGPVPPADDIRDVYYPNVIEYMLDLAGGGCYPDCNGDNVLNILDFVCFQQEWQNQTPAGDCDGNNQYNILDFVCFQQAFQAGCN